MKVLKKDGLYEDYDFTKIRSAVEKSARRACVDLDDDDFIGLESHFRRKLKNRDEVSVSELHDYVESILCKRFPEVGKSYKDFRDFKKTAVEALDDLYTQSKNTLFLGDRENANFNSSLTSTKGALMGGYLRKQIYKDYYLTKEEREATKDGYIYIHDLSMLFLGCQNCITGDSWITIKDNDVIKNIQFDELDVEYGLTDFRKSNVEVLSKSGFVKLNGVSKRKTKDDELIYEIRSGYGTTLKATAEHRIPVIRDGEEVLLNASDIVVGDKLIKSGYEEYSDIQEILTYHKDCNVYDLETADHHFVVNNFVVHNCSLFDMGNVLRGGFKMADIGYTEPKTFLSACQVIGDITLSATAGQYGGQQM